MFSSSHFAIAFFFSTICLEGSAGGAVTAGVDDSQPRFEGRRFAGLESDFAMSPSPEDSAPGSGRA
uniref:Uncharacterized protein n=1 Tax=Rhizobium leguminosarum TaxID=384 RepID=A0A179C1Q0_RHILE|nr:hypothetical protein A4U53_36590 [Rhizobium leguminosarum]